MTDNFPRIIGLTGKMASGKTTAAQVLVRSGAWLIDVDQIGHQLLERRDNTYAAVVNYFGSRILDEAGQVDRGQLSRLIAQRDNYYQALNSLMHPAMRREVLRQVNAARKAGARVAVVDAALLYEMGLDRLADEVWRVEAKPEVLKERLAGGYRQLSAQEADSRLKAQAKSDDRKPDVILANNGPLEHFVADVEHQIRNRLENN